MKIPILLCRYCLFNYANITYFIMQRLPVHCAGITYFIMQILNKSSKICCRDQSPWQGESVREPLLQGFKCFHLQMMPFISASSHWPKTVPWPRWPQRHGGQKGAGHYKCWWVCIIYSVYSSHTQPGVEEREGWRGGARRIFTAVKLLCVTP